MSLRCRKKKTKLIVKTLKCQYLLGFIQGLERKRMFFFPGIMAIFNGIVQLGIRSFFFQGLLQPFPNFPPVLLFFLFHRVISGFFCII